ncbi:hypothetical protein M885DRAFT_516252 [Pelagophyceae sp. CCMP2097]|nr:hypothetical protein M885DRAFT_516252 [Pelagophyceae sp. CCMP2097]
MTLRLFALLVVDTSAAPRAGRRGGATSDEAMRQISGRNQGVRQDRARSRFEIDSPTRRDVGFPARRDTQARPCGLRGAPRTQTNDARDLRDARRVANAQRRADVRSKARF